MTRTTLTILLLTLQGWWLPAVAQTQSHDSIRSAAAAHVRAHHDGAAQALQIKVGRLDSRLKLTRCSLPLETFSPPGRNLPAKQTVGVRCNGAQPWSLYVPVNLSLFKQVLVAARKLPRGSVISAGDLRLEERDVARLRNGYLEQPQQAIGLTVKRTLRNNSVVLPHQITLPQPVQRGTRVTILAKAGALQVRMTGRALSDGARGEMVEVENESSQKRVEGRVIGPSLVEVQL